MMNASHVIKLSKNKKGIFNEKVLLLLTSFCLISLINKKTIKQEKARRTKNKQANQKRCNQTIFKFFLFRLLLRNVRTTYPFISFHFANIQHRLWTLGVNYCNYLNKTNKIRVKSSPNSNAKRFTQTARTVRPSLLSK